MANLNFAALAASAALSVAGALSAWAEDGKAESIVSLGGSITEIVYALGQEDRLVARDTTSTYPETVIDLPNVGYVRALSPEGVLSVKPDLVLATEGAGPPEAMQVLQSANVDIVVVPEIFSPEGVVTKITVVGEALGTEDAAARLTEQVKRDLDAAIAAAHQSTEGQAPKVLFVLSAANGRIMAAGQNTSASGILDMAGAQNALSGFEGFKPVTNEAIIKAAPDAILMMDRMGDHSITDDALFALPAIAVTPAGRNRRIVRMNGLHLLGFGPRTASAISELASALHAPGQK